MHHALVNAPAGVARRQGCKLGAVLVSELLGDHLELGCLGAVLAVQQRADRFVQVRRAALSGLRGQVGWDETRRI